MMEMQPPSEHMPDNGVTKISERSMLSIHLVLMLLVFVVWLIRLSDRVDVQNKAIEHLQKACNDYTPLLERSHHDDQ
jgi:hypothetical protein